MVFRKNVFKKKRIKKELSVCLKDIKRNKHIHMSTRRLNGRQNRLNFERKTIADLNFKFGTRSFS